MNARDNQGFQRIATLFVLVFLCQPVFSQRRDAKSKSLTPEMQRNDFELLNSTLEAMHPGVLRYISKDTLLNSRQEMESRFQESRSPLEFFRLLAPYVAQIRCGHTSLEPPAPVMRGPRRDGNLFPLRVCRIDSRWWVLKDLSDPAVIPEGAELLAINGRTMPEVEKLILSSFSPDGFNKTGPLFYMQRMFALFYAMHVDWSPEPLSLDFVLPNGQRIKKELQGVGWETVVASGSSSSKPFRCSFLDNGAHAVIDVRYFGAPGFASFLESTFRKLKEKQVTTVTIDLRGNGGGTDDDGALLCTYLINEPFGYFERIEVTENYADERNWKGVKKDDQSRRIITFSNGLAEQTPADNAFSGRVFVLIDGGTFSTAADVASVLYSNGIGTFVGDESGGGFDGNTSGASYRLKLPHSKIELDVQNWMYTTSIGHRKSPLGQGRGVPVSHEVHATLEERLRGVDVGMRKVNELMIEGSVIR